MANTEELLKDACILKSFGEKYFVSMTLIPSIHQVKVEMVEKGAGGKNGNTLYLSIEKIRQLVNEIDSPVFDKKILAETSKYPEAYQYVSGKDGVNKLNIGKSRKNGYVAVQTIIRKGDKQDIRIMAVGFEEFRQMAFLFKLCTGLIPVEPNSYYGQLKAIYEKAVVEKAKYHKVDKADLQEPDAPIEADTNPAPAPEQVVNFEIKTCGVTQIKGDFYIFPCVNAKSDKYDLYVRKSEATRLAEFDNVRENASDGVKLVGKGKLNGNSILLIEGKVA